MRGKIITINNCIIITYEIFILNHILSAINVASSTDSSSIGKYVSRDPIVLHPIGFVVPSSDVVKCIPEKIRDFSAIDPANRGTYIYGLQDEQEYKRNMRHSRFGYTRKKAGWDAQRHFEIMASGCVPYFEDIQIVPEHTIPFLPKELLLAGKIFADRSGVSFDALNRPTSFSSSSSSSSSDKHFNHTYYNELACCIRQHAENHQTTRSLAKHILDTVNIPDIKNVLILCEYPNFDYMVTYIHIYIYIYIYIVYI